MKNNIKEIFKQFNGKKINIHKNPKGYSNKKWVAFHRKTSKD